MSPLSKIFKIVTFQKDKDDFVKSTGDMADKFYGLGQAIMKLHKEQPSRRRNDTCTYISLPSNKKYPEWLCVQKNAIHLRVEEPNLALNTGLSMMVFIPEEEKFVIQNLQEYDNADDAIASFMGIVDLYADRAFMRGLKEKLVKAKIFDGEITDYKTGAVETGMNAVQGQKTTPQNIIK